MNSKNKSRVSYNEQNTIKFKEYLYENRWNILVSFVFSIICCIAMISLKMINIDEETWYLSTKKEMSDLWLYQERYMIYIYNMIFCSCSFSLMFYGINFLRPASGCFLYLVSKGRSAGCARNDNSVSFHHAMFAHQCRNSEKYGINFFPDYKTKTESFTSRSLLIEISLFNIHHL